MKMLCKLPLVALVLALAFSSPVAVAAEMVKVKKVDNFILLLDQSGSMAETHATLGQKKIELAVDGVSRLDKAIPALDFTSSMELFSPAETLTAPALYKDGVLAAAATGVNTGFSVFGRFTALGDGLMNAGPVIGGFTGKTALVVFTDGDSNSGSEPVAQAKALYSKYPELCIHIVSFADSAHGQAVIDQIRDISCCTVDTNINALASDATLAQFAKDVFYDEVAPKRAPAPAPVPVPVVKKPVPMKKEVITFSLQFGFDKSAITDEMVPILEQVKMLLDEDKKVDFTVAGHTDSTGAEDYNQGLSERRAASVKGWLVSNGTSAARLDATGYGESQSKYDNATKEGRALNRRVEIQTK